MLTALQVRLLRSISPRGPDTGSGDVCEGKSRLAAHMGPDFFSRIAGKQVIDFGCGEGGDALEIARHGAARVIGIDYREDILEVARRNAVRAGVQDMCRFVTSTDQVADVIISVDAFEHFADPAHILRVISNNLRPSGEVLASFGPTWYHPRGGHLFSVFPWSHLIFSEKALIEWRSAFRSDGATCFGDVAGGLNQMTIRRFEDFVARSPLQFASFELVPIRKVRRFHKHATREFTTAVVRCRLVHRDSLHEPR